MTDGDAGLLAVVLAGLAWCWRSLSGDSGPDVPIAPPTIGPGDSGPGLPTFQPDPPAAGPAIDPAPSAPPPAAPVQGSGDMIDPANVSVVNSPNLLGGPITARIRQIVLSPNNVQIFTEGLEAWPAPIPPGFDDPIQFTVWALKAVGGHWYGSGFIEGVNGYHGADGVGDGIFDFPNNWWYSDRWAPMTGQAVAPGETIGFLLTQGDARDSKGPWDGQRTQIVTVQATDNGSFIF